MVKLITKGGAAVDQFLPNKDKYRVVNSGGKVYACTLNFSDCLQNNNKCYIIQVLQSEANTSQYFAFTRWGRVGAPGQQALKGPWALNMAINEYMKKHREKTSEGYVELDIKYDEENEKEEKKPKVEKKTSKLGKEKKKESKLSKPVQDLMTLIFDQKVINNTIKEIGYDMKKMPLGKLGDNTIKEAYNVLNELLQAIKNKKGNQTYAKLSSEFYTLIPHDFGFKNMQNFILQTEEEVKKKSEMLAQLSDMKITTKLLQESESTDENIIDQNYKKLKCEIRALDHKSDEFKFLEDYVNDST